jgi:hypothetical protein
LSLPWAFARTLPYPLELQNSFDLLQSRYFFVVCAFMIGTIASFITPLAIAFQIAGIVLVVDATQKLAAAFPDPEWAWCSLLLGFYIGIISIIIILIGILYPIWTGHKPIGFKTKGWIYDRLFTFQIWPKTTGL